MRSILARKVQSVLCSGVLATVIATTAHAAPLSGMTERENAKPGTTAWQLSNPATHREIEGYASLTSVNRGGEIRLYVNTSEPAYTIEIFRLGWYDGAGGRQVMGAIDRTGVEQPMPTPDPTTGLIECRWSDPFILKIPNEPPDPTDWASGVYLAKLTAGTSGKQGYIIFVVRDDGRASDLLFQSSVTTFQAYNNWGGKSLYGFNSIDNQPAPKVSFNRPYAPDHLTRAASGMGSGDFFLWEYPLVRFLEREGYDVTYATNIDVHTDPNLLLSHKAFLSVGHDEYWSWDMRKNVERARDAGVSLGFFSANTCYWQIRLEPSLETGDANRTIVAYKESALRQDPFMTDGDPTHKRLVTTRWRDWPVRQPEESLIGVMYVDDPVDADVVIENASHWVFAGTGLQSGDRLPGLLGYEVDRRFRNAPTETTRLAHSLARIKGIETIYSDMTIYTASSGAIVFAAGTIQWSWGLDDYGAGLWRSSRLSSAAQQITRNILARFITRS